MKRCLTIAVMVLFCLFSGRAQVTPQNRYDFNFIKSSHPWLTSSNAAGLIRLPVEKIFITQAGFDKNNGGLWPITSRMTVLMPELWQSHSPTWERMSMFTVNCRMTILKGRIWVAQ